jgi:threonine dehydrogenase-like Zn-dependent dehydrogenase
MARRHGIEVVDAQQVDDVPDAIRDLTDDRGTDSTIDAVGMEAHGSPAAQLAQAATGLLPGRIAAPLMETAGVDRLTALKQSMDAVRRGGTPLNRHAAGREAHPDEGWAFTRGGDVASPRFL